MITAGSIDDLAPALDELRSRERTPLAFIPTMGALHDGHLSLVEAARAEGCSTVVSIFVNPKQFAPGEDLEAYPRDPKHDIRMLEAIGCDVAFLPGVDDVYPPGFATVVTADRSLTGCLCGASRGGSHFDGVVTVLARLFGIVRADFAWFGAKDWQQYLIVERMAADIHPATRIRVAPTIRDADGLAMSSRNSYLSDPERAAAAAIPAAIGLISGRIAGLEAGTPVAAVLSDAAASIREAGLVPEYVELRDARTLAPVTTADPGCEARIFLAARAGSTRLIDNSPLEQHHRRKHAPTTHPDTLGSTPEPAVN